MIFSPIPALILLLGLRPGSIWLSPKGWTVRLALGVGLAAVAVTVYSIVREGSDGPLTLLGRIAAWQNVDELTQVFLEDLTIALLLSRLVAGLGRPWVAVAIVAALFAAGHVPTMLEKGAGPTELAWLLRDVGLGGLVLSAVVRGRDILWFVPLHFAMDMTQFARISGA